MEILKLDSVSIRVYGDIEQLHQAWIATCREQMQYGGGLRWKRVGNHEYLFRGRDRLGHGRSMGRRSEATEKLHRDFHERKELLDRRVAEQSAKLAELSRYAVAARLNRAPEGLRIVMHQLDIMRPHLNSPAVMVGTNCLYAFELMAGVRLESGLLATMDVDILQDNRHEVVRVEEDTKTITQWIRRGDRTYQPLADIPYRLVNNSGFMVDIITAPSDIRARHRKGEVVSAEIEGLEWLLSSPRIERIIMDERGVPFRAVVPSPESFALHKAWLARRRDRDALKRQRDKAQSDCIFKLFEEFLPPPEEKNLRHFPKAVRRLWPEKIAFARAPRASRGGLRSTTPGVENRKIL